MFYFSCIVSSRIIYNMYAENKKNVRILKMLYCILILPSLIFSLCHCDYIVYAVPLSSNSSNQNIDENVETNDSPGFESLTIQILIALASTTGVGGALLSSYLTYHFGIRTKYLEDKISARNNFIKDRIESYSKVFPLLESMSSFHDGKTIDNTEKISTIYTDIVRWYYNDKGGLLMSSKCNKAFLNLQRQLKQFIDSGTRNLNKDEQYQMIEFGENFKNLLVEDLAYEQ